MRIRNIPLLLLVALILLPTPGRAIADGDLQELALDEEGALVEGPKPCGAGTKVSCGKVTLQTCTQWKQTTTTLGGTVSPTGGGLTYTEQYTCVQTKTVETTLYKNP